MTHENIREHIENVIDPINFRDSKDLKLFMRQFDILKPSEKRLFSWLIAFNILNLHKEEWIETIANIVLSYYDTVKTYFGSFNDKFYEKMQHSISHKIETDIERLIPCIMDFFKSLNLKNIESGHIESYKRSVKKILALTSLYNKKYVYIQGYDRYIVPIYMYAVSTFGIDSELTEPLTFRLYMKVLDMANPSFFLMSNSLAKSLFFLKLHVKFFWNRPDIIEKTRPVADWEKIITIRWLLLTYADEYPLPNLLLLWDYVFLNNKKFSRVRDLLCVEHILQLPKVKDPNTYYGDIQNKNDWDLEIILAHLDKHIDSKLCISPFIYMSIIMIFLFMVLVMNMQRSVFKHI